MSCTSTVGHGHLPVVDPVLRKEPHLLPYSLQWWTLSSGKSLTSCQRWTLSSGKSLTSCLTVSSGGPCPQERASPPALQSPVVDPVLRKEPHLLPEVDPVLRKEPHLLPYSLQWWTLSSGKSLTSCLTVSSGGPCPQERASPPARGGPCQRWTLSSGKSLTSCLTVSSGGPCPQERASPPALQSPVEDPVFKTEPHHLPYSLQWWTLSSGKSLTTYLTISAAHLWLPLSCQFLSSSSSFSSSVVICFCCLFLFCCCSFVLLPCSPCLLHLFH